MRTVIARKPDLVHSNIGDTDSYKFSHWMEYPDDTDRMFSYFESRGGEFNECTLFGLQVIVHRQVSKRFTIEDVYAEKAFAEAHGEPFNIEGWLHILKTYGGVLPIRIRAIPEGLVIPPKNVLMTVESVKDPKCFWITNWLETKLSRLWYPSTIAIASRQAKKIWKKWLDLSTDEPEKEIWFKHHDFGSRGVTCLEQAELGGAAHLLSFLGSDTTPGVKCANHYYDIKMAGFSIPATEHSTMTIWGRHRERKALVRWIQKTLVERQLPPGVPKISACVADSYDVYQFVNWVCDEDIREMIKGSGGTLVVRPDSGDPRTVLTKMLKIFVERLPPGEITTNKKGYLVLPSYLRIIWGDGISLRTMDSILEMITSMGWSASNIAFGSGGGLLQMFNRDSQKFAFKCCSAEMGNVDVDVCKDPITDPGKKSKVGRLDLIKTENGYETVRIPDRLEAHPDSVMVTYFDMGDILYNTTFEECRTRMAL